MIRFYVTLTWDNWPEGGSYGTIVEAETHAEAEAAAKHEMAAIRAEEDEEYDEPAVERLLEEYDYAWQVVDCFDLDLFIRNQFQGPPVADNIRDTVTNLVSLTLDLYQAERAGNWSSDLLRKLERIKTNARTLELVLCAHCGD